MILNAGLGLLLDFPDWPLLLDPVGEVDLLEETEPEMVGDLDLDIDLLELTLLA